MNPGWYAHILNHGIVAYFDGTEWGAVTDRASLTQEHRDSVTPLPAGHFGPVAPFEQFVLPADARPDAAPAAVPQRRPSAPEPAKRPHSVLLGWVLGLGSTITVLGFILGFTKVSDICGSPFNPDNTVAELTDAMMYEGGLGFGSNEADCIQDIASASAVTWALLGLGVLTLLTWLIVRAITGATPRGPVQPTVGSQIQDLAGLRAQGIISDDEFEAKKTDLLSRM
ncbi:SHOCT domain-containing protein [Arthrobacter sp. MDT2-16]